jgi:hypothetical protein
VEPYDGGSQITFFKVYWDSGSDSASFTPYTFTVDPDINLIVNTGLVAGNFYSFKVVAVN